MSKLTDKLEHYLDSNVRILVYKTNERQMEAPEVKINGSAVEIIAWDAWCTGDVEPFQWHVGVVVSEDELYGR